MSGPHGEPIANGGQYEVYDAGNGRVLKVDPLFRRA